MNLGKKTHLLWFVAAVLLINSGLLRTMNLDHSSYWVDEMSSIFFSSRPTWTALFWDNSPPLYHFILKFWMVAFGEFETATRSLSAILSVICTALWMRFGYRRHGYMGVVIFGLLHGYYSLSVMHGRETRMYALFEFACTLLLFRVVAIIEKTAANNGKDGTRTIFVGLFTLFTHALAFIPVASTMLLLPLAKRINQRQWYMRIIAIAAVGTALLWYVRWDYLGWQQLKYQIETSSRWPWLVLNDVLQGPWGIAATIAVTALIFYRDYRNKKISLTAWLLIYMAVVFCLATIAGRLADRSVFLTRYYTFLTPVILYVMGTAVLDTLDAKRRLIAVLTVAAFFSFLFGEIGRTQDALKTLNADWRQAAEIVSSSPHPTIYTSMPLSIQAPYFEQHQIEFKKLDLYAPTIFEPIKAGFQNRRSVWIMGNYWHAVMFETPLNAFLSRNHCTAMDKSIKPKGTIAQEPVMLFQIFCPEL